jgi:pimeloyl-ACP methyl ester carboxylesterase
MPRAKANGIEIEYESFGREGDPAILLIHGFAAQLTLWPEALCRGLADKGFRVIRFDNRDVGKSTHLFDGGAPDAKSLIAKLTSGQPVAVPYMLDDMAADAAGLLDALGIAKAHIIGASMGGMIAQLAAIQHAEKTKSLVSIMSTTGRRGLPPPKPQALAVLTAVPASTAREDLIAAGIKFWRAIESPAYRASDAEMRASAEREVDRSPYEPTGFARQMAALIAAKPRQEMLKSVRAPALVIHGADDPLVPVEGGQDTAASIPGAELVIVPGMGHDFTDALVPVYLKHIGDFVTKVEAQAKVA